MLVTVVCDLLVASEQLLCTIRECTSQAAVTGLVCQQCLILLGIHSLGGQGEGVLALSLVGRIEGEQVPVTSLNCLLLMNRVSLWSWRVWAMSLITS